jgi:hypothetical protein
MKERKIRRVRTQGPRPLLVVVENEEEVCCVGRDTYVPHTREVRVYHQDAVELLSTQPRSVVCRCC